MSQKKYYSHYSHSQHDILIFLFTVKQNSYQYFFSEMAYGSALLQRLLLIYCGYIEILWDFKTVPDFALQIDTGT